MSLFYMSHKMIRSLSEFTRDMEEPIWVKAGAESRFAKAPALNFLEQNLFRYHRGAYNEETEGGADFSVQEIRNVKWKKRQGESAGWCVNTDTDTARSL